MGTSQDKVSFWGMSVKDEMILDFYGAINMTFWNTLFKERESHLVTYETGPSKI